ncbi:MAG: PAS domain S-box protein [Cyanobacteria bacterium J06635_10]
MQSNAEPIDLLDLSRVINRTPSIVTPDTLVIDAIALMTFQVPESNRNLNRSNPSEAAVGRNHRQTDCVLIIEDSHLLGILTPSDVVRLTLEQKDFTQRKIAEVMTQQVVSLRQFQNHDIFTALRVMRQHGIRHLPIVNEQEHLVGIVTESSLLQALDFETLQHLEIGCQQLEAIAANTPVGIYRFIYHADGSLSIPYASVGYRELLGLNPTDMSAHPEDVLATIHPSDRERFAQAFISASQEQNQSNYVEYRAIDVLGQVKWIGNNFRCFASKNGDLVVDGVDIDITTRRRAEVALQTSEERFRSLVEISSDCVWEINERGFFTYTSPKVFDILGYHPGEILGKMLFDLMSPQQAQQFGETITSFMLEKQPFKNLENVKFHKDGHSVVVETSGVPIFDARGQFRGYRGIDRDITSRKQALYALRESEERFRLLVTHAPVGIFQTDCEGECIFVNPRWLEFSGIPSESAMGKGWAKGLHPEDKEQVFREWYDAAAQEREFAMEYRFCTPQGKVTWVFGNAIAIYNQEQEITGYLGTLTDITSRKLAEDKLRWTEATLQEAQRIAKIGSFTRDLTTNERWWSEQFYRIINLNPGDAMPEMETIINSIVHPEDRSRLYHMVIAYMERGIPYETEVRLLGPDDSIGYVFICGRVERDSQGKLRRYYGIVQDISEYKRVELELRESKERYCSVVKSMHEGVVIQQADGKITSCNASAEKILGLSAKEIKGRTYLDPRWHTIHEDGSPFPGETHPAMITLHTGKPSLNKVMGVHKPNGELTWILINSEPLFLPGETIPHAVVTSFSDITRRKEAEEKIAEQAQLLNVTTDAILVKDLNETILYCNRSAERIYGWTKEEIIGKSANELLYQEISPELEEALKSVVETGSWLGELHKVTASGKNIIVASRWTLVRDEAGNPESILTVDTDITEKKQLENQFLRIQRLESLGTLASGIAHDLNNMLTPILAIAQLLPLKLKDRDDLGEMLSMLENSAKRGANLVKQILTFARGNEGKRTVLQINHLLKDIEQFATGTFPKSIVIQRNISQDLLTVLADPTQIHQVLMNLVVNARDAMPHGGTITMEAYNLYIDENYARMNLEAKVGHYIVVTIADTGGGIPPEIIDRIFDPFFTTKEVGKGTGLGLSTAIGIIKSHGGFFEVNSELGKGSQFKVYLPSSQETRIETAGENITRIGNSELILVVDDEAAICEIIKTTLESHNFEVFTASDGIEAISSYVQHKKTCSLVLMDMMMPEMDGATAIRTLQQLNPQVQIIAMSGLASTEALAKAAGNGIQGFLAKPFTKCDLLNTINAVLSVNSYQ